MVSRVPWEGLRVTWRRKLKGTLATCLHQGAGLSSLSGPDTWTQHRLLTAQGSGDLPGASGCVQGAVSWSSMGSGG